MPKSIKPIILGFSISAMLLFITGCPEPPANLVEAPTTLTYSTSSALYYVGEAITANSPTVDQACDDWSVSPDLPVGLSIDAATGTISGTPVNQQIEVLEYTVTAANESGSTTAAISLRIFGNISLSTNQDASLVIGKSDFTTSTSGCTETETGGRNGNPVVAEGKLFLPDQYNSRVLGYNTIPVSNGAAADFVLGQQVFDSGSNLSISANSLNYPVSVAYNGTAFFVVDSDNLRVLQYNTLPTATFTAADIAVGMPNLVTDAAADPQSASTLSYPMGVFATQGKLIVADTENNRVLIWNSIPTVSGAAADIVLGQQDFASISTNGGLGVGAPTAQTFYFPSDVWSNGQNLIVADTGNNRVLIWTTFPTQNGQSADVVLGQADMTSADANLTSAGMNNPHALTSNGTQLFVCDTFNNRVLVWNAIPTVNGTAADAVLGQADFTANVSATDVNRFPNPSGIHAYNNQLFVVADTRCLVFNGQ